MSDLWDFLRGALMTKALAAVVDAGVPEALADGPRPVSELRGDEDTLYRLLRALASDGVFHETEPRLFEHTERSRLLLAPGWSEFAHLFGGVFFPFSGLPTWAQAVGWKSWAGLPAWRSRAMVLVRPPRSA